MKAQCRTVAVIGIRYNCTALRNKQLYNVMRRVADLHPGEQGSRPSPSIFFNGSIFIGPLQKHW